MPAKFEPNWRDWALSDRFKSVLFVITVRLLIKPSSETAFMRGNPLFLLSSAVADWYLGEGDYDMNERIEIFVNDLKNF